MTLPAMSTDALPGAATAAGDEGELLTLGRRGQVRELIRQAQQARSTADWNAACALELALACLLAGELRQADLALLEADQLDPSLGLVPDVWGLWPTPALAATPGAAGSPAAHQLALELAERFRRWRHPDPQSLWQQLLPQLRADWRDALEPPVGDALLILVRASAADGAQRLDPPLESELLRLVGDAEIAAEPAASSRFWRRIATIRPQWDLARIRAADLTLARGEMEACVRWLADPPASAQRNPWFHDVSARYSLARGDVEAALRAWSEAIQLAEAQADNLDLVAVFTQRCREARRGPGVLQVRTLAKRGEQERARALLEKLLAEDPQWQPLCRLHEQLNDSSKALPSSPPKATAPVEADKANEVAASRQGDIEALLDHTEACLRSLGVTISTNAEPPPMAERGNLGDELAALERRISEYEARFALA